MSEVSEGCVSPVSPDMDYKSVVAENEAVCPEGYKKVFLGDLAGRSVMTRPRSTLHIVYFLSFFDRKSGSVLINRISGTWGGSVRANVIPHPNVRFWTDSDVFDGIQYESRCRPDLWVYVPIETDMSDL